MPGGKSSRLGLGGSRNCKGPATSPRRRGRETEAVSQTEKVQYEAMTEACKALLEAVEEHERKTCCDQWHPVIKQAREALEFPHYIYCGGLDTMQTIADRGVRALNCETMRWSMVSKTARYLVRYDGHIDGNPNDKMGSLWSDQDLRGIAKEKSLVIQ